MLSSLLGVCFLFCVVVCSDSQSDFDRVNEKLRILQESIDELKADLDASVHSCKWHDRIGEFDNNHQYMPDDNDTTWNFFVKQFNVCPEDRYIAGFKWTDRQANGQSSLNASVLGATIACHDNRGEREGRRIENTDTAGGPGVLMSSMIHVDREVPNFDLADIECGSGRWALNGITWTNWTTLSDGRQELEADVKCCFHREDRCVTKNTKINRDRPDAVPGAVSTRKFKFAGVQCSEGYLNRINWYKWRTMHSPFWNETYWVKFARFRCCKGQ